MLWSSRNRVTRSHFVAQSGRERARFSIVHRRQAGKISIRTVSTFGLRSSILSFFFSEAFLIVSLSLVVKIEGEGASQSRTKKKENFLRLQEKKNLKDESSSIHRRSDIHLRIAVLPIFVSTVTFASDDDPDSPSNSPELVVVVSAAEASSETRLMTNVSSFESDRSDLNLLTVCVCQVVNVFLFPLRRGLD